MGEADIEQDDAGAGIGVEDPLDGQPDEELLLLQSFQSFELAEAEVSGNEAVEMREAVVLGVAGLVEVGFEKGGGGVEGEIGDGFGEEAGGEAVGFEEVVDRVGDRDEGEEEEEEED